MNAYTRYPLGSFFILHLKIITMPRLYFTGTVLIYLHPFLVFTNPSCLQVSGILRLKACVRTNRIISTYNVVCQVLLYGLIKNSKIGIFRLSRQFFFGVRSVIFVFLSTSQRKYTVEADA